MCVCVPEMCVYTNTRTHTQREEPEHKRAIT